MLCHFEVAAATEKSLFALAFGGAAASGESAPHCLKPRKSDTDPKEPCPKKELWAKQVLDENPRNKNTKFYVSDDEGKTWTEAKKQ